MKISSFFAYFRKPMGLQIWELWTRNSNSLSKIDSLCQYPQILNFLTKMIPTLKIHNLLCNLKLHYFFKVWCQLGKYPQSTFKLQFTLDSRLKKICTGQRYLKPGLKLIILPVLFRNSDCKKKIDQDNLLNWPWLFSV